MSGARGQSTTSVWVAGCKDCSAERAGKRSATRDSKRGSDKRAQGDGSFEYSGAWADRALERGLTRSDRCKRHRQEHAKIIQAIAVPYIDLVTIGQVDDPSDPNGPLGGLGPLPVVHKRHEETVDLNKFEFGMSDADVLAILEGLSTKQFGVIEAGTGTGKSTFMPFRLMNPPAGANLRLADAGPIIVTEPRRAAATGVARFVGEELCLGHDCRTCSAHIGPGYRVGYQVKGEQHWDDACDLVYVTDGTMINWLRDGRLARLGAVIIDEAHERSENIDIILAQLRELAPRFPRLKVIITSATLDRDFFVEYFGGEANVFHHSVPATKSFGYGVPLFVGTVIDDTVIESGATYAGDASNGRLTFPGWPQGAIGPEAAPAEDLGAETEELERLRCVEEIPVERWRQDMPMAVAAQVLAIARGTTWGDILAFLPTNDAINTAVERIKDELQSLPFDVYPLLSTTPKDIADKAIAARARGDKRKIVVSSNLAETSLTVKGVRYVVDSGLICQSEWDPQIASGSFPTKPHSQSGLRQRWGRVGRDSPGWVFPLYTPQQFLALPANTPPGSTQVNLEAFYMKLISAGLEPGRIELPSSFEHPKLILDTDGERARTTFKQESERALRALAGSGATDADGHLTEFGREIERFAGEGCEALATMFADQLACVHEVGLALEVLGKGLLYGDDDDAILHISRDWPNAWRVRAAQHHRALGVGCEDDLDVLLRIYAAWERAPNQDEWCRSWWVNQPALAGALDRTYERLAALSPAMKREARREIAPELAERARGVLTKAMVSARFSKTDSGYRAQAGEDDTVAVLGRGILDVGANEILALSRYRPRPLRDGSARSPVLSHWIRAAAWTPSTTQAASGAGIALAIAATQHAHRVASSTLADDVVRTARRRWPVGTVIDVASSDPPTALGWKVETISRAGNTFRMPEHLVRPMGVAGYRAPPSGFDREWDPDRRRLGETPEEESAIAVLDIRAFEADVIDTPEAQNANPTHADAKDEEPSDVPGYVNWLHELDAPPSGRAIVTGYATDGANVVLVVEPTTESAPIDPADHRDLTAWQALDVTVMGLVKDHEREYIQFDRDDERGRFYLEADWSPGLDPFDRGFLRRLEVGSTLEAHTIPGENGRATITLRSAALAHMRTAPARTIASRQGAVFYDATILTDPNELNRVEIELDHKDDATGMSHRFGAHVGDLRRSGITTPAAGQPVLVAIKPDRGSRRNTLRITDRALSAALEKRGEAFQWQGDRLRAGPGELSVESLSDLLRASKKADWQREVWEFFADALHCTAVDFALQGPRISLPCSPRVGSLLRMRRAELEAQGVTLAFTPTQVELSAPDEAALRSATATVRRITESPRAVVKAKREEVGRFFAPERRKRAEDQYGVVAIGAESDALTVVAATEQAARNVALAILARTAGELTVPAGMNGRIVGAGGAVIKALREATGCSADNPNKGQLWLIAGPARHNVEEFLRQAISRAPGATGRITRDEPAEFLDDITPKIEAPVPVRTVAPPAPVRTAAPPAPPPTPSVAPPRTTSPPPSRPIQQAAPPRAISPPPPLAPNPRPSPPAESPRTRVPPAPPAPPPTRSRQADEQLWKPGAPAARAVRPATRETTRSTMTKRRARGTPMADLAGFLVNVAYVAAGLALLIYLLR